MERKCIIALSIYYCLLTYLGVNGQVRDVGAYFSMSGVKGYIELTAVGTGATQAVVNLSGTEEWTDWEIREFPVLTTDSLKCDDALLGNRIHNLSSYKNIADASVETPIVMDGVSMFLGENAILGRSLLLTKGEQRACATIQGQEPLSFAVLKGHIAGNVHVRQVGTRFAVFTDLFYTGSPGPSPIPLKIYPASVSVDLAGAESRQVDVTERCGKVAAGLFVVASFLEVPVAAGGSVSRRSMSYVIDNISDFDFTAGSVLIGDSLGISCANFHRYEQKTVQAIFSRDGVNGAITFTQINPYKPTEVQVDFQNLGSQTGQSGGYHVHKFPLPYEFTTETDLCGSDVTGGHFNPFSATTGVGVTQDEFEIGDLSGKYGTLAGISNISASYTDLYLPLFGQYSIVGRSIVIHSPSGARWICANIGYPGPVSVAKAEFNGDVEGTITFVQEEDKPWADTTVFVEMKDAGDVSETTFNHNYHIHTNPIGDDYLATPGRCVSAGGHWNPFDAAVTDSDLYKSSCAANRLGCEVGDLNNKYNETINMASGTISSKYLYTDEIPLSGAYSVIKRSVTIHQQQAAAARYVCADIVKKLTPRITTEDEWQGDSSDVLDGSIQLSSSGLPSAVATLNVMLSGLNQAGGYHIHQFPLNSMQPGNSICGTTGGHYNPLDATNWSSNETQDRYEVGDLSSKFKYLTDLSDYQLQDIDTNLPLSGAYSVAGRSVVIHDSTSRWKCANTVWDTSAMNGTLLQAKAEFYGTIEGHITFSQVVTPEGESDVNIEVMLWYSDPTQAPTVDHNWHVHISSIDEADCASAGGHYNPFNKLAGSEDYKSSCDHITPRRCEFGDMSGKLSKLAIGAADSPTRYVFNDNFLSLNGKFAVIGRSIVIHAAESGAARVACTDIAPFGVATQVVEYHIPTPKGAFKDDMAAAIAESVGADNTQTVYVNKGASRNNCTAVEVYFTGDQAMALKQRFEPSNLTENYTDIDICNTGVNGQNEINAFFSMAGVAGNIEFREPSPNRIRAIISITASQRFQWEIREFPVLTTDPQACDDASLGRTIRVLNDSLDVIDGNTVHGTTIDIPELSLTEGNDAIIGRSILLKNGAQRACATIQGPELLSFAVVKGHVAGNIQVRPVGKRFAVFTDLFNTISLTPSSSSLRMYRGDLMVDLPSSERRDVGAKERCNVESMINNMVAVLKNVPIAAGGTRTRFMSYISLNTMRPFDFSNGWLKIGDDSHTSCANFHRYEPKTVQAVFSRDGVNGYMIFKQDNPYKPTSIQVDLQKLNGRAHGYHVHMFPLPYEYSENTNLCGVDVTSGHFNPFLKTTGTTQEEFEIGDLSGKHGFLDSLDNQDNQQGINQTFTDLYLPLFGQYSIVGRSIVIHSPAGGARWICANIGYPGPVSVVAKAEFNGDVEGTITFVQEEDKPWADTSVFVEMTDAGDKSETTFNHNYHIHTHPIGEDYLATSGRCDSAGGHWNPFDAAVTGSDLYKSICAADRLGCEVGDLSSKYNETINMAAGTVSSKYLYTDEIPLSGAYSVIKRSVTIHQQQKASARYVCADIVKKLTPVVTTEDRWYGVEGSDTTTGKVQMSSSGLNSDIASVNVGLNGLGGRAGGYHIHELPLNTMLPGDNICGTTSGHYNPFGITQATPDDSLDNYEIGDLSNKFGMLTNRQTYSLQTVDTNLPLSGAYSVAGRSVVIHDSTSKWKCANTVWDTSAMNGTLLQARADFKGEIQGHITLSQVVTSEGESDVNVEVMLWNDNDQQTSTNNHNWHVHVSAIHDAVCSSAGGHYNPFQKDTGASSYSDCGAETPRKCEAGDMSGKFGTINIGTKEAPTRYVFNDNFLSLSGKFSVMGRSIVIHSENAGAPRIACADLAPFGQSSYVVQFYIRTGLQTSANDLAESIKRQLEVNEAHNIYVQTGAQKGICTPVSVHFVGEDAEELKEQFDADSLELDYQPVDADSCNAASGQAYISGLSLLLLLFAAIVH